MKAIKNKYSCIVEINTDFGLLIPFVVQVLAENEVLACHAAMTKVTLNIRNTHGLNEGYVAYANENDVLALL